MKWRPDASRSGGGEPPGYWGGGGVGNYPDAGLPGPQPGGPTHIWGPGDPRPQPPIANVPGLPPMPSEPPTGEADEDGFLKPPPPNGGWAYHEDYGWMFAPHPGAAGPK